MFVQHKLPFPKTIISNKGIPIKITVLFELWSLNDQQAFCKLVKDVGC